MPKLKRPQPIDLTPNARTVLEARYLLRDEMGKITETPEELFQRVAHAVSSAESRDRSQWEQRFYEIMAARRFLPNSPTLMNAGLKGGQLSACYVLPVGDSLDQIFDTLKYAAKVHQSGGGTGFGFSKIRPSGSTVMSTQGAASGPVSFIRIFDAATETIRQGGKRRGANMAVLRVDHPDIVDFIDSKRDRRSIRNFNFSVGITDEFMAKVRAGGMFSLRDPKSRKSVREVVARELFERMVQAAWECGDPGLVFLDRIGLLNPTPLVGEMESTNPCGEQPLLPYESCNLGSINLGLYARADGVDWDLLRADVGLSVRLLDDIIDINQFPLEMSRKITKRNRKIGLGVMGFADLLLLLKIPYDAERGRVLGEQIMSFIAREGRIASAALARSRGAFPNWKGSLWERLKYPQLRNATITTVAPTGTISMIAGASGGIEPIFAGVFYRNVLSGARLKEVHPAVERAFKERGLSTSAIDEEQIASFLGAAWKPAQRVSVEDHVKMQAVFQRHSDSAVSKTINLPESATPQTVERAYLMAYEAGCKGITVYRDKSRPTQVLDICHQC